MKTAAKMEVLVECADLLDSLHKTPKYVDDGFPMVRVTDIRRGFLDLSSTLRVDSQTYEEFTKRYQAKEGDILFTRVGSYGNSCYVRRTEHFCLGQNTVCISPKRNRINPFYLYCCLNSDLVRGQIDGFVGGASQPTISLANINKLSIPFPAIGIQERISSILLAYDDLIENNTRRIKILEEMAQMIYREWFVNFRFPGHEKVRMVESELGPIPKGWTAKCVTDAVFVNPATKVPKEGVKPFLPMGCLADNSMLITKVEEREGNSGAKFKNGDTLFARITPCLENGKTGFVQFLPSDDAVAFGSTEFIVLRSRTVCPEYVYLMARSDEFRDNAIKSMSGASGRQRVREACFEKFFIAEPNRGTLERFQGIASPVFRLIHTLSLKNDNLRTTRDLLLPKLISGEIPVEAAEDTAAELTSPKSEEIALHA